MVEHVMQELRYCLKRASLCLSALLILTLRPQTMVEMLLSFGASLLHEGCLLSLEAQLDLLDHRTDVVRSSVLNGRLSE